MRYPLRTAGLILILGLCTPEGGIAQVRDSLGVLGGEGSRDTLSLKDTVVQRDTTADADRSLHLPLGGLGSLTLPGLPASILPDTAAEFVPFRTTGDLIRQFGGIFVTGTGVGGFRRKFSVNGMRDGSLLFLKDGLLLNDPSTGMYLADGYPADYAGAIELAPPPLGFFHGPGGTGGAIDFVSRSRRAPRAVSGVRYTQSSYGFSLLDGALSQDVMKGFNVALGLQRPVSDGRFENSALDAWGARIKLRYDAGDAAVHVSDVFSRRQRGLNEGVSFATPESLRYEPIRALVVNPSAAEIVVRHDITAGAAIGADTGALTTFVLEFTSAHREYRDEAGDTGSTGTPFREIRDEQSAGFRIGHSRILAGSRLTVGLEMRNRRVLKDPNIGSHRGTQTGISGALVVNAGPFLSVSPAARVDRLSGAERLSLGAAMRMRLGDGFALTGGASRSHRFPSFAEAFGVAGLARALDSPDPERHDVISGGLFAGDSAGTFATVTAFHRKISGIIAIDSAGTAGSGPGDSPLAWLRTGDESRSGVSWVSALRVGSFVAELSADYLAYGSGTRRRYAPAWDLAGGVYLRDRVAGGHLDIKAGFRGRYFTSYDGEGYAQRHELFVPAGTDVPPAATLDFILFAGIGDAVIHFLWENLLDRQYAETVFYPADDRAVRFGLTWDFLD